MPRRNKDNPYDAFIMDNGDDTYIDYSDLSGYESEGPDPRDYEGGKFDGGDCMLCGAVGSMKWEGDGWYYCKKCETNIPEDAYIHWNLNYNI